MVCKRAQLSFSTKTCNSADTSAVGLVAADPCGYELCCPVLRQQCRLHIGGSPGVCRSPRISLWRHLPKEIHSIPFTCHRNMRKKKRKGQNCHCLCVVVVHCTLYILYRFPPGIFHTNTPYQASPFVPSGCNNAIEQRLGMEGQCQAVKWPQLVDTGRSFHHGTIDRNHQLEIIGSTQEAI